VSDDEVRPLRIGTRGSDLALWQAREVARRLACESEVVVIKTEGDRQQEIALQGTSTTGFFTKAIERRLADGEVDLAVHSLKDLPTQLDSALELGAVLPRAPITDMLLVHPDWADDSRVFPVREGCVVGAGSLRRQALVRLYGAQARPELIRGNVPTRVRKCRDGEYGAVVLARAGVERLGLDLAPLGVWELSSDHWLPAPGQGAVAVEIRRGDERTKAALVIVGDESTASAVTLERRLLSNFEGGCHTAFGAHAVATDEGWTVDIGMDRGELGWGQIRFVGSFERCVELGPPDLERFEPRSISVRDELCREWTDER